MYKKGEVIKLKLDNGEIIVGRVVNPAESTSMNTSDVIHLSNVTISDGEKFIGHCIKLEVYVRKIVYRSLETNDNSYDYSRKINQYEIKPGGICEKIN